MSRIHRTEYKQNFMKGFEPPLRIWIVGFNAQLEDPVDTEIVFINGTQNSQAYKEPFNSQNGSAVTVKWNFVFLWILLKKNAVRPFQKRIHIREIIEDFCR